MTRQLLISARDPGAAAQLGSVARRAMADPAWQVMVLAAPPADRVLTALRVPCQRVTAQGEALHEQLRALLATLRPDAVLTGLSGPDRGLDEALLAAAEGLPRYLFQDYWGDLNPATPPGVQILCLDTAGVAQTRARHGRPARAVGSPAHDHWPAPRIARRRLQQHHRLRRDLPVIGLCDQPLWQQPGYADTLRRTLRALPPGQLLVRPHPRTPWPDRLRLRRLLRQAGAGRRVVWSARSPLPDFVAACDLLLSAYSSCALDAAQYNRRAGHPGTVALNLLCDARLYRHYRAATGFDRTPLADSGLALDQYRHGNLAWRLAAALAPGQRRRLRRAARRTLPAGDAAAAVLALLATDLGAGQPRGRHAAGPESGQLPCP